MTREGRQQTRARFGFACAYCGVSETLSGQTLTIDHFQPTSRGGADEQSNWVACCHACNEFKGAYWPTTPEQHALLHPEHDVLSEHLREGASGELEGATARGLFHISRLHLNRPELLAHRLFLQEFAQAQAEREMLFEELRATGEEVRQLRIRIENS